MTRKQKLLQMLREELKLIEDELINFPLDAEDEQYSQLVEYAKKIAATLKVLDDETPWIMEEIKRKSEEYKNWLRAADDDEERDRRRMEYKMWYQNLPEKERAELRETFQPALDKISDRLRTLEGVAELAMKGSIYYEGEEYLLGEWVTIADYARLHNIKLNRVTNWISRKVIPPQNVKVFPELNNLKLLRNQLYREVS